ncbi:hypothetical protein [Alkalibacillus almallahensis]|uniref:hypothetical protein n=1 Tax=Alkalibacillus almallahensis TaxID=1379154 RepID=UPI0014214333|nr:hypothetical protein [Alkalibacillus almallahensis]NIK11367.1 hypothetical protein [Alkalibacillus almallahensis]
MLRMRFYLYTSFVLIYIINLFATSEMLTYIQGAIGLVAVLFSIHNASRTYQLIGIIFASIGAGLFIIYDLPTSNLLPYMTSMGLLISLLYLIPFINHFMIVGKFDQSIYQLLQSNTHHLGSFYAKSYLTSYVLTLFIFLSMVPLSYQLVKDKTASFNDRLTHEFATRSILRPLATANAWSPIEVYIALVVGITGAYYLELLPVLLGFSLIMAAIDIGLGYTRYRSYKFTDESTHEPGSQSQSWKHIGLLGLFLVLFVATAAITHNLLALEFFDAIILTIVPFTIVWALAINRLRTFIHYNREVWHQQLWTMQNFIMLLVPIGFFNEVVQDTGVFEPLLSQLSWLEEQPLWLFIFIFLSAVVLAFAGFHPLVTLSLQGIVVTPFLDTISPLSVSVVMVISVVANDMTGTFNIPITMLNQYFKRNPYQLTLWNIGYALLFGAIGVGIALLFV